MVLTSPKLYPQERLDLEDMNTLISAGRTDSKYYVKEFLSPQNYVLKGFAVSGIGLKVATIAMTDATLIIGAGTGDFSFFSAQAGAPNITIQQADLLPASRNYIELSLSYSEDTPITKAFWDPSANGGLGAEFNQEVNTAEDVAINPVVVSGGFTGSPDRLPLAIIDTDGSGNIQIILDRRNLFHRAGLPTNIFNTFPWASNIEPGYSVTLTSESGTFVAGETVTFSGSGVTATVQTGGTTSIVIAQPSNITFAAGETLTGSTSSATGTVATVLESFTGADKDIACQRDMFLALMTEI